MKNIKSRLNISYAKSLSAFVHDMKNKWMWFAFLLLVGFSSLKRRKQNIDGWKESVNKSCARTSLRSCGLTAPAGAAAAGLSGVCLPGWAGSGCRAGPTRGRAHARGRARAPQYEHSPGQPNRITAPTTQSAEPWAAPPGDGAHSQFWLKVHGKKLQLWSNVLNEQSRVGLN